MYRPFSTLCKCGYFMEPLTEPHWDNTFPKSPEKEITVDFWCCHCSHVESYTYHLPRLHESVAISLVQHISRYVETYNPLLTDRITMNTSNSIEEKGLLYAIAYLSVSGLVYDIVGTSFKLTFLGWVTVWHGPY